MAYQRTRTSNNLTVNNANYDTYDANCGQPGQWHRSGPFNAGYSGSYSTMTDWVTPRFKELSAKGSIILTDMSKTVEVHQCTGNFSKYKSVNLSCAPSTYAYEDFTGPWAYYYKSGQTNYTKLPRNALLSSGDISDAISVAATKAWSNSNAHSAELLVDLAELRQTLDMLRNPLAAGGKFLKTVTSERNKRLRRKGVALTTLGSDLWLQYRYGIRPLVSSVNGVLKALQAEYAKRRSTYRGTYNLSRTSASTGTYASGIHKFDWSQTYSDVLDLRAGILLEDQVEISNALGLDAAGMLQVPWEIVPFSFVADWFANVGDFIGGQFAALVKRPLGTWYTMKRSYISTFSISNCQSNSASYTINRAGTESRISQYIDYSRIIGLPGPSLVWKPQGLDKVLTDFRSLDAITLFHQQLVRAFR